MNKQLIIPESLPNLPSAIAKIQQMFLSSDVDNVRLVKILEEDSLLCANILKLVNSPHYGLSKKVSSVSHAVMLLGSTIIRGIVMAAVLKKSFPLDLSPYGLTVDKFDTICSLRVKFLNEWMKGEEVDMQMLSSAVFLLAGGKLVTSYNILQNGLFLKFRSLLETHTIQEAERMVFGMDSYEAAALLYKKWNFEEEFTALIGTVAHPYTKEQKILHIISLLIGAQGVFEEKQIEQALELIRVYGFNEEHFLQSVEKVRN